MCAQEDFLLLLLKLIKYSKRFYTKTDQSTWKMKRETLGALLSIKVSHDVLHSPNYIFSKSLFLCSTEKRKSSLEQHEGV